MLEYFIPSVFVHSARHTLMGCRMGLQSTTKYIDEFQKYLVNCVNISESKTKFIFEMNLADWLRALVLPNNYKDLYTMIQ